MLVSMAKIILITSIIKESPDIDNIPPNSDIDIIKWSDAVLGLYKQIKEDSVEVIQNITGPPL